MTGKKKPEDQPDDMFALAGIFVQRDETAGKDENGKVKPRHHETLMSHDERVKAHAVQPVVRRIVTPEASEWTN